MVVLSHRGYWKSDIEKNQISAFKRSFALGFGTETDIRDYAGKLVISHDMPNAGCLELADFFTLYKSFGSELPLALNIKADGLQSELGVLLRRFEINNYFVFDMSVPDALSYLKHGLSVFTRQSEYEQIPSFYMQAAGVWLDEFHRHWIDQAVIARHIEARKRVCIVSPDLHRRDYLQEWAHYREIERELEVSDLMICTDHPEEARSFFEQN